MRFAVAACTLVACYTSQPTAPLSNAVEEPRGLLVITPTGVGPIDADTPATLMPLRRLLVGFEVKPVEDGGLQYEIYRDGERLAYVVPDDEDGTIFNIHAVSPRVEVASRDWRVGAPFRDARRLTHCECWGEHPTCFRKGEHVAVNFDRECYSLEHGDRREFRVLNGLPVQRVIWSPRPFGVIAEDDEALEYFPPHP